MPVKQFWDLVGSNTPVNKRSWGQIYFVHCLLFIRWFALLVQMRIPELRICIAFSKGKTKRWFKWSCYQFFAHWFFFLTSSFLCGLFSDAGRLTALLRRLFLGFCFGFSPKHLQISAWRTFLLLCPVIQNIFSFHANWLGDLNQNIKPDIFDINVKKWQFEKSLLCYPQKPCSKVNRF